MDEKTKTGEHYACVIKDGKYVDFVIVEEFSDGTEIPYMYTMKQGESLVEANPPTMKVNADSVGFIFPTWDGAKWVEFATPQEIATFDEGHPVPVVEQTEEDVMRLMASKLLQAKPKSDKIGYKLELAYSNSGAFTWEYVADENYAPTHSGDYIDPIPYVEGMTVMQGNFYTDGEDIWEAIKNGTPVDFADREYFDIIG